MDALIYELKYSQKEFTKEELISEYNFNNDTFISRITFYEKEKIIPLKTYETNHNYSR